MLRNPSYWRSYYRGDDDELRLSRAFSFSDRCRYYWPQPSVQEEVKRLLHNLDLFSCPLTVLSQYLPLEYEAIRQGALENHARPSSAITFDGSFDFMVRPAVHRQVDPLRNAAFGRELASDGRTLSQPLPFNIERRDSPTSGRGPIEPEEGSLDCGRGRVVW